MNKDEMTPRTIVAKANPKAPLHPASYEALIASLTYLELHSRILYYPKLWQ